MAVALFTLTLFHWGRIINTLAAEILISNSTGLFWPEDTTIQQIFSMMNLLWAGPVVNWFVADYVVWQTSLGILRSHCVNGVIYFEHAGQQRPPQMHLLHIRYRYMNKQCMRIWLHICNLPHLHLAPPLCMTPSEFCGDFTAPKKL